MSGDVVRASIKPDASPLPSPPSNPPSQAQLISPSFMSSPLVPKSAAVPHDAPAPQQQQGHAPPNAGAPLSSINVQGTTPLHTLPNVRMESTMPLHTMLPNQPLVSRGPAGPATARRPSFDPGTGVDATTSTQTGRKARSSVLQSVQRSGAWFKQAATPRNMRERLRSKDMREAFQAADVDQRGYLEVDQVVNVLKKYGMDEFDAKDLVLSHDTDGSGKIEFEEYCMLLNETSASKTGVSHSIMICGMAINYGDVHLGESRYRAVIAPLLLIVFNLGWFTICVSNREDHL